jgi:hypothetical protein
LGSFARSVGNEKTFYNIVGSTDPTRGSNSRPMTPPSLDIVEEELAKLGRETDVDADVDDAVAASSQKLLQNDVDDFDEDDLVSFKVAPFIGSV